MLSSPGCSAGAASSSPALACCVEYISTPRGAPPAEQRWNAQAGAAGAPPKTRGCSSAADERQIQSPLQVEEWSDVSGFPADFHPTPKKPLDKIPKCSAYRIKILGDLLETPLRYTGAPEQHSNFSVECVVSIP